MNKKDIENLCSSENIWNELWNEFCMNLGKRVSNEVWGEVMEKLGYKVYHKFSNAIGENIKDRVDNNIH